MLYDDQAPHYDERVGIPEDAAAAVAAAIDDLVGLGADTSVLEPGVGTGLVSIHLLRYPVRYIGFDRSREMLGVFRAKIGLAGRQAELYVADGNERWPADDHSVDVVFCARSVHHIEETHVVAEVARALRDGGWLVVGRVRRPGDSVKSQMRSRMRELLAAEGVTARSHDRHTARVFSALEALGAKWYDPIVAARWSTTHRPVDSIASWESKDGLGAVDVPPETKHRVMLELHAWAAERYGDIERAFEQVEAFELQSLRLPAHDPMT